MCGEKRTLQPPNFFPAQLLPKSCFPTPWFLWLFSELFYTSAFSTSEMWKPRRFYHSPNTDTNIPMSNRPGPNINAEFRYSLYVCTVGGALRHLELAPSICTLSLLMQRNCICFVVFVFQLTMLEVTYKPTGLEHVGFDIVVL